MPPHTLYDGGKKTVLLGSISGGGIPQDIWDKNIMGSSGLFGLPLWRRGFYGTSHAPLTYKYMAGKLDPDNDGGSKAWLQVFDIDPACLRPEVILSPDNDLNTAKNPAFTTWLQAQVGKRPTAVGRPDIVPFESLAKLQAECFLKSPNQAVYVTSPLYELNKPETRCGLLLKDYEDDFGIKTVIDTAESYSWFFRDRSCVKTLSGTADELLALLLRPNSPLLRPLEFVDDGIEPPFPYLMISILAEATGLTADNLQSLHANLAATHGTPAADDGFQQSIAWWWDYLDRLVGRGIACSAQSKLPQFQARLEGSIAANGAINFDALDQDGLCN